MENSEETKIIRKPGRPEGAKTKIPAPPRRTRRTRSQTALRNKLKSEK